eukprot:2120342-Pleurochrysis_carterae.AAC.2
MSGSTVLPFAYVSCLCVSVKAAPKTVCLQSSIWLFIDAKLPCRIIAVPDDFGSDNMRFTI